jgi:hypothetical protein
MKKSTFATAFVKTTTVEKATMEKSTYTEATMDKEKASVFTEASSGLGKGKILIPLQL